MFLKRTLDLIEKKGISKNKLLTDLQLSKNSFVDWQNRGTVPSADTVAKIADYLDCSVDYLLGRTDSPTTINSHNTVNGSNNIIGNGNNTESKLSDQESALIDIFNKLDVVSQAKLLVYATELEKEKN